MNPLGRITNAVLTLGLRAAIVLVHALDERTASGAGVAASFTYYPEEAKSA